MTPPEGDRLAKVSRARAEAREFLPSRQEVAQPVRRYFCRTCGTSVEGQFVPEGWYSLNRHQGALSAGMQRLGLYCSIDCLSLQIPRLDAVADAIARGALTRPFLVGRDAASGSEAP